MTRLATIFLIPIIFALAGCIKETYDFDRFSTDAYLSPSWVIPAIKGDVSFSDLAEEGDTVVFGEDNFVRIILREDSVIDLRTEDLYDLTDMISFSETYSLGRMNLASFGGNISYSLGMISQRLSPPLRDQFIALDGTSSVFPSFPVTILQETAYSVFPNFEYAIFDEGYIDITVKNNLNAPVENISVALYNTEGHLPVGTAATIASIDPGQNGMASINLEDNTVTNYLTAAVTISSPGTTNPVNIDLDGNNIEVTVSARDLWVRSGKIVVPLQNISALGDDGTDTVEFDPGDGIELELISLNSGNISYTIDSKTELNTHISLTLPTTIRNGLAVTEYFTIDPNVTVRGDLPLDNTVFDLGTMASHPFNMIPAEHVIMVSSNGRMVNFSSLDEVRVDLRLPDPDFDYVKGYFGQETVTIDPETIDPEIRDIISRISGELFISNPSVRFNYSNSFSIPAEMDLQITGYGESRTEVLELDPFSLSYPAMPDERDISGSHLIYKDNSQLPGLISLPPYRAVITGTVSMNPHGNTGSRDNYISGNSRISGSVELDIPLDLRMKNLQFSDTVDNFLRTDDSENEEFFDPDDFEYFSIRLYVENGFPAGISASMMLFDSEFRIIKGRADAGDILEPAPVDSDGRVTSPAVSETNIPVTEEFLDSVDRSDAIIIKFTLNTTGDGLKDVKIYSDYRIFFTAGVAVKPGLKFKLD